MEEPAPSSPAPGARAGSEARAPLLAFDGVTRRYGARAVVDRVSLTVEDGEFVTFLGPSGCGKT